MMQQSIGSPSSNPNSSNIGIGGISTVQIGMPSQDPSQQPSTSTSGPSTLDQIAERLFSLSPIEVKDDYEDKMCRSYSFVQTQMTCRSEHQIHEELTRMCRESSTVSDEITVGLIVSMLLDFHNNSHRLFIPIILSNRDGNAQLCSHLNHILNEKFLRLNEHTRHRLLLLCKELLRIPIQGIESIFYALLRNIISGDTTPRNLQLAESVLDILIELRFSYDSNLALVQYVLFKYLRLIADHTNNSRLLEKEVKFCHCMLLERFQDFLTIGRDLIRLLQQICRVPEFEQLWKLMLTNPSRLTPKFNLVHMLKTRTHRRYIRLLITCDMEKKIGFLVGQVRLGSQRRYQDWFQRQYLNTSDNTQMLRTDLIRFVCNFIHPSNEVIASDLVPRWAVIGWLLNSCPNQVTMSWTRMALFYDWLMFDIHDGSNNQIMDLEPGLLVMYFSLKNYTGLTNSLLDFLCRIATEFFPPFSQQIKQGICNAFIHQMEKRVTPNLSFMFDPARIEPSIRQQLLKVFPDLQAWIDPVAAAAHGPMLVSQLAPQPQLQPPTIGNQIVVIPNGHYFSTNPSQQISSASAADTGDSSSSAATSAAISTSAINLSSTSSCYYNSAISSTSNSTTDSNDNDSKSILEQSNNSNKDNGNNQQSSCCHHVVGTSTSTTTMTTIMLMSEQQQRSSTTDVNFISGGGPGGFTSTTTTQSASQIRCPPSSSYHPSGSAAGGTQVIAVQTPSSTTTSAATSAGIGNNLTNISHNTNNKKSYCQSSLATTISKPNLNPILTNIKSINVVKQISSLSSGQTSPQQPLEFNNPTQSTQIVQMVHMIPQGQPGGPTLNPISTNPATTMSSVISSTNQTIIQSQFSDDEEDSMEGSISSTSNNPNSTNSSASSKVKPPAVKKMKRSSFNSGQGPASIHKPGKSLNSNNGNNKNGGAGSLTLNPHTQVAAIHQPSSSSPSTASLNHQNSNNPDYIANILNSTVMNQSNVGGPQQPHIVSVITSSGGSTATSTNQAIPTSSSHHHLQPSFTTNGDNSSSSSPMSFNSGVGGGPMVKTETVVTIIDSHSDDSNDSSTSNLTTNSDHTLPLFTSPYQSTNNGNSALISLLDQQQANSHFNLRNYSVSSGTDSTNPTLERSYRLSADELQEQIEQITNDQIKNLVIKLSDERNQQTQCYLMEQLVKHLIDYPAADNDDDDDPASNVEFIPNLTMVLSSVMDDDMSQNRFPSLYSPLSSLPENQQQHLSSFFMSWLKPNDEIMKESIEGPLFVMFHHWVNLIKKKRRRRRKKNKSSDDDEEEDNDDNDNDDDDDDDDDDNDDDDGDDDDDDEDKEQKNGAVFKTVLAELATNNVRVGFLLLHYLTVTRNTFQKMICYRNLIQFMGKDLYSTLLQDLETCHYQDGFMFFHLIPSIMRTMGKMLSLKGNMDFIELLLMYGDFNAIQYLCTLIQRDQFHLLDKEHLKVIVVSSFRFDYIQQQLLWDLVDAHDFPMEAYLQCFPVLDDSNIYATTLNHLKQIFKRVKPTKDYLRVLIHCEHKLGDFFVVQVLVYWAKRFKVEFAEVIGKHVSSIISSPNKRNKRTLNNMSKNQAKSGNKIVHVEQLLYYLDEMRKALSNSKDIDFFHQEFLNVILDQLKQICNSQHKVKYAELFANVPEDNDNNNNNGGNGKKKKQNTSQNSNSNKDSATESESSEDDVPTTRKSILRNKKRKQTSGFDSD